MFVWTPTNITSIIVKYSTTKIVQAHSHSILGVILPVNVRTYSLRHSRKEKWEVTLSSCLLYNIYFRFLLILEYRLQNNGKDWFAFLFLLFLISFSLEKEMWFQVQGRLIEQNASQPYYYNICIGNLGHTEWRGTMLQCSPKTYCWGIQSPKIIVYQPFVQMVGIVWSV